MAEGAGSAYADSTQPLGREPGEGGHVCQSLRWRPQRRASV